VLFGVDQARQAKAFESAAERDRKGRVVGPAIATPICAFAEAIWALGLGDVGAALEQIRGHAGWNGGQPGRNFAERQPECGSGLADQYGDCILILSALLAQQDCLGCAFPSSSVCS